ncbi:MAG: helix-turn-helix domain-containing protein [Solirubrobacteraceae bacterium]|nr:helix-turn-helix domain-containing protein [Solirubrobacteraceae bacterium]
MRDDLDDLARRIGRAVHAHRAARGESLGEVSRASGLSKTILARIERGEGNPSMETLWKLSQALGVGLGALVAPETAPRVEVLRAGEGAPVTADSGLAGLLLYADTRARRTELFTWELPARTEQRSPAHLLGTEELLLCTAGAITVGPADETVELRAGDLARFAADVEHVYATGARAARTLNLMLYG